MMSKNQREAKATQKDQAAPDSGVHRVVGIARELQSANEFLTNAIAAVLDGGTDEHGNHGDERHLFAAVKHVRSAQLIVENVLSALDESCEERELVPESAGA